MRNYLPRDAFHRQAEQRRSDVHFARGVTPGTSRVCGTFLVAGAGEVLEDVNFPVVFVEKPSFSFGFEMPDTAVLVAGDYPTASVGVARWRRERLGTTEIYAGATLVAVTTGPADQNLILHWQVEAKAIVHPVV